MLALGSNYQLYDPYSTVPTADGKFARQPLPGNIIPQNRINPSRKRCCRTGRAQQHGGDHRGRNNYTGPPQSYVDYDSHFLRIDQAIGPNHRLYGSYNQYHVYALQNIYFGKLKGSTPRAAPRTTGTMRSLWTT